MLAVAWLLTILSSYTVGVGWCARLEPESGAEDVARVRTSMMRECETLGQSCDGRGDLKRDLADLAARQVKPAQQATPSTSSTTSEETASTTSTAEATLTNPSTSISTGETTSSASLATISANDPLGTLSTFSPTAPAPPPPPPPTSTSSNATSSVDGSATHRKAGLSTGAQAGIGVGVGLGGLLIILALAWFCLARRRKRSQLGDAKYAPQAQSDLSMVEAPRSKHEAVPTAVPVPQPRHEESREPYQSNHRASYYEPPGVESYEPHNDRYEPQGEHFEAYQSGQQISRSRSGATRDAPTGSPPPRPTLEIPDDDERTPLHSPLHSREGSPARSVSPVSPVSPVSAMSPSVSREPSTKHDQR